MRSLYLCSPFRGVQRSTRRHPSEIGAISIRRVNGHPHRSALYVADQIRTGPNVSNPTRAGIQQRRHVGPGIYGLRVRNEEYGVGTVAATIAPTSELVDFELRDCRGCIPTVHNGDDCQVVFVVPVTADDHHVGSNMKEQPRPAFKPAANLKGECSSGNDCRIDRNPLLHGHSVPRFLQFEEHTAVRPIQAISPRGYSTTFPTVLGTGAGRRLRDFQCKSATGA